MKLLRLLSAIFLIFCAGLSIGGEVHKLLNEHLDKNKGLINYSKNKDVVLLIGNTGSGKSSLVAYLTGMKLSYDGEDISLEDSGGKDIKIGGGLNSVTMLPVAFDLLYKSKAAIIYDLPGLRDSRGASYELLNAAFIKDIAENARSVSFVFVESYGTIVDGARGELFKNLIKQARKTFGVGVNKESSMFIITKVPNVLKKERIDMINEVIGKSADEMNDGKRFLTRHRGIDLSDKDELLEAIYNLKGTRYDSTNAYIDINSLCSKEAKDQLDSTLREENKKALAVFEIEIPKFKESEKVEAFIQKIQKDPSLVEQYDNILDSSLTLSLMKSYSFKVKSKIYAWKSSAREEYDRLIRNLKTRKNELIQIENSKKQVEEVKKQANEDKIKVNKLEDALESAKRNNNDTDRMLMMAMMMQQHPFQSTSFSPPFGGYHQPSLGYHNYQPQYSMMTQARANPYQSDYQDLNGRWHAGSNHDGYKRGQFISSNKARR
ncbi:hypothetical protein [Cysteiniphilum litorale]|uniref:hypothetical protein n=1 Tax=Cysteiniphilum litorale TaxID=2056700 RepID=UPI003F880B5C